LVAAKLLMFLFFVLCCQMTKAAETIIAEDSGASL
jgi:hypothetical protein